MFRNKDCKKPTPTFCTHSSTFKLNSGKNPSTLIFFFVWKKKKMTKTKCTTPPSIVLHRPMQPPAGNTLTYDENAYIFPLSHKQWYICQCYLATLYKQNTTNLELIKDVYSTSIPKTHKTLVNFQNQADFRMKLRRVFARWSHDVLGARQINSTTSTSSMANTAAQQLQFTHGISDKLYCFFFICPPHILSSQFISS